MKQYFSLQLQSQMLAGVIDTSHSDSELQLELLKPDQLFVT